MIHPRAVLFDVGETLIQRPFVGPGRRIAAALQLPNEAARRITQIVFRERFDGPRALAERLRATLDIGSAPFDVVEEIWRAQEEEPIEISGASACVARVKATGARIGIVSNIWAPYVTGFRRACPTIPPLVESWQLSYLAGVAKPDPGMFLSALDQLAVEPRNTVMVGDSLEKDVKPAIALGMRAVWFVASDPPTLPVGPVPERCRVAHDFAAVERILLDWIAPEASRA